MAGWPHLSTERVAIKPRLHITPIATSGTDSLFKIDVWYLLKILNAVDEVLIGETSPRSVYSYLVLVERQNALHEDLRSVCSNPKPVLPVMFGHTMM